MKKLTIIFYLFLIPLCVSAQNESSMSHAKTVNDSTLIKIHAIFLKKQLEFIIYCIENTAETVRTL